VPIDYDRYVRQEEGPITLMLGASGEILEGRLYRGTANKNGTARIWGGQRLRDWFRTHYAMMDKVDIDLSSTEVIRIGDRSNRG
jgi:hypothetical protein